MDSIVDHNDAITLEPVCLLTEPRRIATDDYIFDVALLTCSDEPDGGEDTQLLTDACSAVGIRLRPIIWSHAQTDWSEFHAVLPLNVWDYAFRRSSFHSWLADREREGARMLNSIPLVRWNMDKTYLLDLQEQGVPMSELQLRPAGTAFPGTWDENTTLVIKPRFGSGGYHLELLNATSWVAPQRDVLVQRYQPWVVERGELSVVCVEGVPVGCFRRLPETGDFRASGRCGAQAEEALLTERAEQAAQHVLNLLPEAPLYCRLDFWDLDDEPWQLVEAELFEPDLHLRLMEGVADVFACALRRRLSSSGQLDLLNHG